MRGDRALWCATAMGGVHRGPPGRGLLFDGFPRWRCAYPGATFTPSLREGTGLNNGVGGSIFFGNDSWKGENNGKGKGKNNRGSFSYHPQAEESAWGPVHSG